MKPLLIRKIVKWYEKTGKCLIFAVKGFTEDQCVLRASALTLYTLLSIVPVMAMAFGVARGFGMQKLLEKELYIRFPGQDEVISTVISFSNNLLEGTRSGLMALLGVLILLYSVVKMFNHIENAFNTIWWIKKGRSWIRKFADYIALFITAPLLMVLSGSATIFVLTKLKEVLAALDIPYIVMVLISTGFKILPFVTIWVLFVFFYLFIPNTKTSIRAALAGGIIAGTVFQLGQMLYVNFQVGVSHYNAIYGSFAALPLFLIWLQASWIILLLGAEIAFAWENIQILETRNLNYQDISPRMKKLMLLRVALVSIKRFLEGRSAPSDTAICDETAIPLPIVRQALTVLQDCGILSEVVLAEGYGYAPAHDIDSMTVSRIIQAYEATGDPLVQVPDTLEYQALEQSLAAFEAAAMQSPGDRRLKDI